MTVIPSGPSHGFQLPRASQIIAGIFVAGLAVAVTWPLSPPADRRDTLTVADPSAIAAANTVALESYLKRRAVLLLIRSRFDVVPVSRLGEVLAADVRRLDGAGPSAGDAEALDRDLLAEGSYYLVALRYLVQSGGAAWPLDRPGQVYDETSLIRLDALLERLFDSVAAREDPLPIFLEAQGIQALTEGFRSVPKSWDRFGERDRLVTQVIASHGPVART